MSGWRRPGGVRRGDAAAMLVGLLIGSVPLDFAAVWPRRWRADIFSIFACLGAACGAGWGPWRVWRALQSTLRIRWQA